MSAITTTEAPKRTIFAISGDLLALHDLLEENGGDITNDQTAAAVDAWFKELNTDLDNKVDAYCLLIKELEGRASVRKQEADRMATRARVDENAAKSLKERLKFAFEGLGLKKVETKQFSVRVQANGGKTPVDVTDEASIPDEYIDMIPKISLDKVREALEAGTVVPGAALKQRGTSLRIT